MATATTHGTIRQGSSGADVALWQSLIRVFPADGKFGPATTTATKQWQSAHGLSADGVVGPASWTAALSAAGASVVTLPKPPAVSLPTLPGRPATAPPAKSSGGATAAKPAAAPAVAATWDTTPGPALSLPTAVRITDAGIQIDTSAGNRVTIPSANATTVEPINDQPPTSNSTVAIGTAVGAALGAGAAYLFARTSAPRNEIELGALGLVVGGLAGMHFAQSQATKGEPA